MITTRQLELKDLPQIVEIEQDTRRVMGGVKPKDYSSLFRGAIVSHYLFRKNGCMYGTFEDDKLQAFLCVFDWKLAPYYTITNMKVRRGAISMISTQPHFLSHTFKLMFQEQEELGRYKFYFLRGVKGWPRDRCVTPFYEAVPELKRYHRVIELYVPKHTLPDFSYARQMFHTSLPVDSVIECATLYQQHRPTRDLLKESP